MVGKKPISEVEVSESVLKKARQSTAIGHTLWGASSGCFTHEIERTIKSMSSQKSSSFFSVTVWVSNSVPKVWENSSWRYWVVVANPGRNLTALSKVTL